MFARKSRTGSWGIWALCVSLLVGPWVGTAQAEETWLLTGGASLAVPVGGWQSDDFGLGGALSIGAHRSLAPWLLVGARLDGLVLFDGGDPGNGRKDLGTGTLGGLSATVRLRPLGTAANPARGTGPYVEGAFGGMLTGGDVLRPGFQAAVGWGFAVGDVDLGPTVRFVQVIQGDDLVDSSDARMVLFGLELGLFDGRAKEVVAVAKAGPADRDQDGIPDEDDACPEVAEDKDGFEDTDGCPDPDNDKDNILDADDRCPNEAEDVDGYDDTDGCPDPDNDDDDILDVDDQCPTEAEVVNGVDDADGCPDEGLIEMVDDRIVLEETVLFDFERARIKSSAKPILRAIVTLWKQHEGEWTRFRIEGHSDARGDKDFNDDLSWRRAQHVRDALVAEGIPMRIMDAEGFGSRKLRDLGTTEKAHQRNRRVEFVVSAKRPKGTGDAAAAPPDGAEGTKETP